MARHIYKCGQPYRFVVHLLFAFLLLLLLFTFLDHFLHLLPPTEEWNPGPPGRRLVHILPDLFFLLICMHDTGLSLSHISLPLASGSDVLLVLIFLLLVLVLVVIARLTVDISSFGSGHILDQTVVAQWDDRLLYRL